MTTPQLRSLPMLRELIGFDTTSRNSNLQLIDYVREYLSSHGVESRLTWDDSKGKANLFATLGPVDAAGGLILSGHRANVRRAGALRERHSVARDARRVRGCGDPFYAARGHSHLEYR